jgi:hypothetical protein
VGAETFAKSMCQHGFLIGHMGRNSWFAQI